jgi:hypothetical protein
VRLGHDRGAARREARDEGAIEEGRVLDAGRARVVKA